MQPRATATGVILLIALLAEPSQGSVRPADAARRPPTPEDRRRVRLHEHAPRDAETAHALQAALQAAGGPVDVQRYTIDLKVIPAASRIEGTVRMEALVTTAGLTALDVALYDVLTVGSVQRGATPLAFTRSGNALHIALDRSYGSGETLDLTIVWSGTPPVVGYGSFTFRTHGTPAQPIVSSLSEDIYAPSWWPCIDLPADKALVEMNLNVPDTLTGVSNGTLASVLSNGDGTKTFQWRSVYPISTYLVSVAISNYATFTDTYYPVTGVAPMLVQHWVYPEKLAAAQVDFSVTVPQLTFFSGLFGEYPFVEEKYGHALFPFGGGMEHQTATSYGAAEVTGDHRYDWIVAHELAHQWWGDSVTLSDWKETWLNEGFASYAEALWWEHLNGPAGLRAYMAGFDSRPFCGTLADPGSCDNFGHTVYDKGAWVLHMLRHVVGDAAFFAGLRNYGTDYKYANATTPDFRAEMESASARALGAFFDRWVYQQGEPAYTWGWTAARIPSGWVPHVRIEQVQSGGVFEMPIDLRVVTTGGMLTVVVEDTAAMQDFALPAMPDQVVDVLFDPDGWILKTATETALADADMDGVPDTADNCVVSVNPAQEDLDGDGAGDLCDPDIDGDGRLNGSDCAPEDPTAQDPPDEAAGLAIAGGATTSLSWAADPAQGSGVLFEVLRGDAALLAADGGVASAFCLATGLASPATGDAAVPPADGSFYYLVRKRNACGAGTLGTDSSGAPRQSIVCP